MPFDCTNLKVKKISKLSSLLNDNRKNMSLTEKISLLEDLKILNKVLMSENVIEEDDDTEQQIVISDVPRSGDIDLNTNVVRLDGIKQNAFPMDPMEKQSIVNFKLAKPLSPNPSNPNAIRYDTVHDNLNTTTIIQKMQNSNEYNFVAFQRIVSVSQDKLESPLGDGKIRVISTKTFKEPTDGGNVLSDLLKKLDFKYD